MRRLIALAVVAAALLSGCSGGTDTGPLQVTSDLVAAKAATSPPTERPPAGTVIPTPAAEELLYVPATGTLALAVRNQPVIALLDTAEMRADPRTVRLPAPAVSLHRAGDGVLLAALPAADQVARIDVRTGTVTPIAVSGAPVDVVPFHGALVVARREAGEVAVLEHGRIVRTIGGFRDPARLLPRGDEVLVLDRLTTSLTPVDPRTGDKGAALRVGEGATHAVLDRFGRVVAVDTRGAEIMAFATDPLIMKQRYPVPGSPYGLAYDPVRDLAWVTLTARNELVAYDIAGGQPQETHRLPTVRQPNSLAVNPAENTVYVASATGRGVQVVRM